jgi:hypothetical protein
MLYLAGWEAQNCWGPTSRFLAEPQPPLSSFASRTVSPATTSESDEDLPMPVPLPPPQRGSAGKSKGNNEGSRAHPRMSHADFRPEDIDRLDKMMLIVAAIGLATNLVQIVGISNHAWLKATAMSNGQPFTAYLSLGSAKFGNSTHPSKDSKYFCNQRGECSLRYLCASPVSSDMYPNGMVFNTPQDAWCRAETAGRSATRFLFFGLLLGLGATGFTGLYAAQAIPCVADQFDKIEEMGFEDIHQKYIIFAGWTALWIFTFASMFSYALTIPDSLGWGDVELESSFGLLRVCFVLVSIQCALVANSVFDGPLDEGAPRRAHRLDTPPLPSRPSTRRLPAV